MKRRLEIPKRRLISMLILYILVGIIFLGYTTVSLVLDKTSEDDYWDSSITVSDSTQKRLDEIGENATIVTVGTYVENLKELSLKNSNYTLTFIGWFSWDGDEHLDPGTNLRVYKGDIKERQLLKETHRDGYNYQQFRFTVCVSKNYWTIRFPLESHQLRFYLESNYTADQVQFKADKENSGVNPSLSISGYTLVRNDVGAYAIETDSTFGNPDIPDDAVYPEFVTAMEINRDGIGLYIKCIIALLGTSLWVLIVMFINTNHRIDPLSMIPAALFGTVSNIMIGANLLPDALQFGLLEYVNMLGIMTILGGAISIINVNRIRTKYQNNEYARQYGLVMFYTVLGLTVLGHILLPISAFLF